MQTKPKAYAFLEGILTEAGYMPGHQPAYIKELYPELHRVLTDELSPQVPDEHISEFCKIQMTGADGEALQRFIDAHIPDSDEAFETSFRKFRQWIVRVAMLSMAYQKK